MTSFIVAIVLLLCAIGGVAVRKTYSYVPLHELKRRAQQHDAFAAKLYQAASYEGSLRGLLWLFIAGTSAGGFVLLARVAPVWLSLVAVIALLWVAFSWLPASRVTSMGARMTALVTPFLSWLLSYLHPIINRIARLASRRYSAPSHTGLFERDDLLELLRRQQVQSDSRLSIEELSIVEHVLTFADHHVRDVLTPRGDVRTVHANETVGPILIDELHQTGLEHVIVQDSPNAEIVGTLAIHEISLHSSGRVRDVMDPTVYYVHESDNLSDALHAFFVTNHPLFVVTNSFEEYVGVLTVANLLRQLLGRVPGEAFDQYADLQAVAGRHPKTRRTKKTDGIAPEVLK